MKKAKVDWKSFSRKEKWEYIWDYYKIHIIVGILVLCLGTYTGVKIATHRDPLVSVIMLNSERQSFKSQPVFEEFLEDRGYEVYSQAVRCHSNFYFWEENEYQNSAFGSDQYENVQMLQAYYALLYTREYDVIFGVGTVFDDTLKEGCFEDLTTLLPENALEIYEGDLIYYTDEETGETYPCAVRLSEENGWLQEHELYHGCTVGVLKTAPNKQIAGELIHYLLSENSEPLTEENS